MHNNPCKIVKSHLASCAKSTGSSPHGKEEGLMVSYFLQLLLSTILLIFIPDGLWQYSPFCTGFHAWFQWE